MTSEMLNSSSLQGRRVSSQPTPVRAFCEADVHVVSGAGRVATVQRMVLNELLAYVCHYRNSSTSNALSEVILKHCSADEIAEAKRLLVHEFQTIIGAGHFITERRNSVARLAKDAEVDDIIGILYAVDAAPGALLDGYLFVASNFSQLPKYGPEEINLASVVDRQVRMETSIQDLSSTIQKLSTSPQSAQGDSEVVRQAVEAVSKDMTKQLVDFNSASNARLEHLSAVCTQLAQNAERVVARNQVLPSPVAPRPHPSSLPEDRALNLVVYGVAEDRSAAVWRKTVDDALHLITGRDVDVTDCFRVGRFVHDKVRPIIVKLRTAWDRRIILSNCRKLKDFLQRIGVSADEPLEARRRRTMEHKKSVAEREGKSVEFAIIVCFLMVFEFSH